MRLSLVGPVYPYRGGIAHYTALLARHLHEAGHTVQVISFRRQYPRWLYPGETDRDTSREPMVTPADFLLDPLHPWTWLAAARAIRRSNPDLVIISWWTTFWAPAFAALARLLRAWRVPVAFLIHNVMPHDARPWDRLLARAVLASATAFLVQTEKEAARLRGLLPGAHPMITPHPVYNMFAGQALSRADARARLRLPADARVVLFFGIVRPYKGLRYLIEAMPLLRQDDIHLVIAGEFWEPEATAREQIHAAGVSDRVHIFNAYIPNEDVPLYFSAADVFAAPYVDGTQSGAVKMAVGFGLPVVLTRCIVDETLDGQPGVAVVPERDARSLAAAIEEMLAARPPGARREVTGDWGRLVGDIESLVAYGSAQGGKAT